MGQVQSQADESDDQSKTSSEPSSSVSPNNSEPTSIDALFAEATAFGNDEESLDAKAQKALECPCIADLRKGLCGTPFSDAFLCFLKSTAEEKGSDCVHQFVALQSCIKANPNAFSKDILGEDEEVKKQEEPTQEYKIIPPLWSVESQGPKPKL